MQSETEIEIYRTSSDTFIISESDKIKYEFNDNDSKDGNEVEVIISSEESEYSLIESSKIKFSRKCLGSGAHGTVILGYYYDYEVAIKRIQPTMSLSEIRKNVKQMQKLLIDEVKVLTKVKSPHCVRFYGCSSDPPFIVIEYCPNGNLFKLIEFARENPKSNVSKELSSWDKRLSIAISIATGIRYLHELNNSIIHGDLKTPNILIDKDGRVKVTDFGLSRFVDHQSGTSKNVKSGPRNPLWASPEILKDSILTKKADVYSFGIILWELLTFQRPYAVPDFDNYILYKLYNNIVNNDLRPEIPEDRYQLPGIWNPILEEYIVLMKNCWLKNPTNRPDFYQIEKTLKLIHNKLFLTSELKLLDTEILANPIEVSENSPEAINMDINRKAIKQTKIKRSYSVILLLLIVVVILFITIIIMATYTIFHKNDDNCNNGCNEHFKRHKDLNHGTG